MAHLHAPDARADAITEPVPRRAGFVVSREVGGAVTRNAVRRRLRHVIRDRLSALPPGSVLVVRALPGSARASATELAADIDAALRRLARPRPGPGAGGRR